jgi:hypothetical protein
MVHGSERMRMVSQVHRLLTAAGVRHSGEVLPTVADLNACLGLRSDVAKFVARLSGQIENIVWVDGPNRAWLAGLIAQGLQREVTDAEPVLRAEAGWPLAQQRLLQADDEPVFIYCSAGEWFPNSEGFAGTDEQRDALNEDEPLLWAHHEGVLRGESEREDATSHLAPHPTLMAAPFSRELRPINWCHYFFAE